MNIAWWIKHNQWDPLHVLHRTVRRVDDFSQHDCMRRNFELCNSNYNPCGDDLHTHYDTDEYNSLAVATENNTVLYCQTLFKTAGVSMKFTPDPNDAGATNNT